MSLSRRYLIMCSDPTKPKDFAVAVRATKSSAKRIADRRNRREVLRAVALGLTDPPGLLSLPIYWVEIDHSIISM